MLRGTLPDIVTDTQIHLLKNVSILHATYQVRLLAFLAQKREKQLVIHLPSTSTIGATLQALMTKFPGLIAIERS